jgi:uncharacterized protein GlcG (DUF336 family)
MKLDVAQRLIAATQADALQRRLKPLAIVVLDARGAVKAAAVADDASLKRYEIAHGKAHGAIAIGIGSRGLHKRALEQPYFMASMSHIVGGPLVPVAGGILIRDQAGVLLGAIGVSGDTSDNDEAVALAALAAIGLVGDTG